MARSDFPYRYEAEFVVTIQGDGLQADGDGAEATRRRLERRLADDALVVDVRSGYCRHLREDDGPPQG